MLETAIPAPHAWHGPSLAREHFLLPIPDAVLGELSAALAEPRRAPVPTLLLLPEHFTRPAATRFMDEVRRRLDDGPGFVMLDRLPVDQDHDEPDLRRHLVRLWLRAGDRRQFRG
jgi:hypothetical protein